jgi:hypothetical protein
MRLRRKIATYPLGVQALNVPRPATGLEEKQEAMKAAAKDGATGGKIGGSAGKAIGSIFGPVGGAIGEMAGSLLGSATGALIGGARGKKKGKSMAGYKDSMTATSQMENDLILQQNMEYSGNEQSQLRSLGGSGLEMARNGRRNLNFKPIEVERNELIYEPTENGYKLVADFKGGDTHEEGGEPVLAKEGTIIFPGKMRNYILSLTSKRTGRVDQPQRFEAAKSKLPIDK